MKLTLVADSGCWEYKGWLDKDGYGKMTVTAKDGTWRSIGVHRLSWEVHRGPIPDDMGVLHKCDNPKCMNPAHLFLGTPADNNRDKTEKGRAIAPRGEQVVHSKLKTADVIEIRKLYSDGETQRAIAPRYGVTYKTISKIVRRERWKHVA